MYRMIIAGDLWNPVSIQQNWLIWPSSMGIFILSPGSLYGNLERIIDVGLLIELPTGDCLIENSALYVIKSMR